MNLSDKDIHIAVIEGDLEIDPFEIENLQPASYDVKLGNEIVMFDKQRVMPFDPVEDDMDEVTETIQVPDGKKFALNPGEFALGHTVEFVDVPKDLAANIEGRSSYGRTGISIHITAGFTDPGYDGQLTLELKNENHFPIVLTPGEEIGQLVFKELTSEAEIGYDEMDSSQYNGQTGAQPSRLGEN